MVVFAIIASAYFLLGVIGYRWLVKRKDKEKPTLFYPDTWEDDVAFGFCLLFGPVVAVLAIVGIIRRAVKR